MPFGPSFKPRLPRYVGDAWAGRVTIARLFFVDMAVWGTIVNLTTTGLALALFAGGAPVWLSVTAWVLPWPMNGFLCACVWRTARRQRPWLSDFAGPLATVWAIGISMV